MFSEQFSADLGINFVGLKIKPEPRDFLFFWSQLELIRNKSSAELTGGEISGHKNFLSKPDPLASHLRLSFKLIGNKSRLLKEIAKRRTKENNILS